MPIYAYKGMTAAGRATKGQLDADSVRGARATHELARLGGLRRDQPLLACALFLLPSTLLGQSKDSRWSIGAGVVSAPRPYEDVDSETLVIPLLVIVRHILSDNLAKMGFAERHDAL